VRARVHGRIKEWPYWQDSGTNYCYPLFVYYPLWVVFDPYPF